MLDMCGRPTMMAFVVKWERRPGLPKESTIKIKMWPIEENH